MKSNSDNPRRGREFQGLAATVLGRHWGVVFEQEVSFAIGHPPKNHDFDLASADRRFVGEAKDNTWVKGGKTPSAKMATVNEAVLLLHHLPNTILRFVVLRRDLRPKTGEPLADYYYRTYRHLLNGVLIVEIEASDGTVRVLGESDAGSSA